MEFGLRIDQAAGPILGGLHAPASLRRFVTSHGRERCEIADLLAIASFPRRKRRLALLLQAKKLTNLCWPVNDSQWRLYTEWPDISYSVGSTKRSGIEMPARRPLSRALYLILPPVPSPFASQPRHWLGFSGVPAAFCPACPSPRCRLIPRYVSPLCWLLADLISGEDGAAFAYEPRTAMSGWNTLVWDLLTHTAFQNAPRKQVQAPVATPRGTLLLFGSTWLSNGGGGQTETPLPEAAPPEGFGVVHMSVGDDPSKDQEIAVEPPDGPWSAGQLAT